MLVVVLRGVNTRKQVFMANSTRMAIYAPDSDAFHRLIGSSLEQDQVETFVVFLATFLERCLNILTIVLGLISTLALAILVRYLV